MKASSALVCALALFALTGQASSEITATPPVTVNWCAFNAWTLTPLGADGQFQVRFTVRGGTAVDDVRFRMLWANDTFTLVDEAGSFAPGAEIRHTLDFQHYGEVGGEMLQSLHLAVDRVHFTNGTSWEAPQVGIPNVKCALYLGLNPR